MENDRKIDFFLIPAKSGNTARTYSSLTFHGIVVFLCEQFLKVLFLKIVSILSFINIHR